MSDNSELTRKLHATTNAMVWAEEWCKVAREIVAADDGRTVIDEGWMVGWFANAMATAEMHAAKKDEPEVVVLPRDALFEFFGQVALPPWQDAEGRWIGGDIDCAPLASRVIEWVERHDLGESYLGGGSKSHD